jgi:hypothetical protein
VGGYLADDVQITWAVPYMDPSTSLGKPINRQATDRLREMIAAQ